MGTNFYLVEKAKRCDHCGHSKDDYKTHIGKASWGWCFSLRVDDEFHCPLDYYRPLESGTHICEDEYGDIIPLNVLYATIEERRGAKALTDESCRSMGYLDAWDFHYRNGSMPGPHDLLRHKLDGDRCIVHGPTTWDGMRGHFS